MTSPAVKRQRTENTTTRSEIWYDDGSVVLQAENTQFRVHWSILGQKSSFFRGMQSLPQPPHDQPTVDGCAVVELHDTVLDVEYLLKALYDSMFLLQKALPLPAVAALIRLGRKYEFRDFFDAAVERLCFENPTTLKKYDALRVDREYRPTRILPYPGVVYDILTLAREQNILSVLPCAYYRALITHDRAQLFDGVPRGDGTVASLASMDQRQCTLGRETIMKTQFMPGYTYAWVRKWPFKADDCANPSKCARIRAEIQEHYMITFNLRGLLDLSTEQIPFCGQCTKHARESNQAGRNRMWEELPRMFSLADWGELKNEL
ncbi:hypothetical protein B0H16DRAFT_1357055 [Mycena metata]|uniref:BTB domain-containing protein n=1 Tax=Mycena metata TaxID=1033252 RepID=A0AAD7KC37_9AGAR|nr:hypothetical protein B0H16DRAFT_1357055 [Mycena metata]